LNDNHKSGFSNTPGSPLPEAKQISQLPEADFYAWRTAKAGSGAAAASMLLSEQIFWGMGRSFRGIGEKRAAGDCDDG
jgi:hypothetical protein